MKKIYEIPKMELQDIEIQNIFTTSQVEISDGTMEEEYNWGDLFE